MTGKTWMLTSSNPYYAQSITPNLNEQIEVKIHINTVFTSFTNPRFLLNFCPSKVFEWLVYRCITNMVGIITNHFL
jgi:hypothetical protein